MKFLSHLDSLELSILAPEDTVFGPWDQLVDCESQAMDWDAIDLIIIFLQFMYYNKKYALVMLHTVRSCNRKMLIFESNKI